MAENKNPPFPELEVSVVVIQRGSQLLAVFNQNWGEFTLPMTKIRRWTDPNVPAFARREAPVVAAARAAAEWCGVTIKPVPTLLLENVSYQQSDRDGQWKRYTFHVFRVFVADTFAPLAGTITEWLTADAFTDEDRAPISQTARFLIPLFKNVPA